MGGTQGIGVGGRALREFEHCSGMEHGSIELIQLMKRHAEPLSVGLNTLNWEAIWDE